MLWDGNRQAQEYTDTHVFTTVYEQDSSEPVARLVWIKDGLTIAVNDEPKNDEGWYGNNKPEAPSAIQIYHYHNDHLGTPNELTNQDGEVVWLADYEAWGNTAKVIYTPVKINQIQVSQNELQPIRFQGQHFDEETGLHYNRFRYYDPDVGMFTTRDPIGLMGGDNVFQYAPNPIGWVDPLGLSKGGKQNINTEGLNTNSYPAEVERRMNEAKKNGQQKRYSTLKGLLKVIRRNVNYKGGCCIVIPDEVLEQANDPCSLHEYSVECQKKRWYEKYGGT